MLSIEQLRNILPNLRQDRAEELLPYLIATLEEFYINTPARIAAFMGQICHESSGLTVFEENLNYSADRLLKVFPKYFKVDNVAAYERHPQKIANRVYASRMGNGDEASGDGWKYRGQGSIQLTGKENHLECGEDLGIDLLNCPELASEKENTFRVAGWFWSKRNLGNLADRGEFKEITRKINGSYNGLDERYTYYRKAKAALGII